MKADAGELSAIERDALAEIGNMGVSRAATSLRQMLGEQVLLSVPAVQIVTPRDRRPAGRTGQSPKLVAVQQAFEGPFSGRALLIFPEAQSLELVRSIVGDEQSLEDVIALEQEALAETGNVILNACLATIANVLRQTMRMSLAVGDPGKRCDAVRRASGQRQSGAVSLHRLHDKDARHAWFHRVADGSSFDYRAEGDRA